MESDLTVFVEFYGLPGCGKSTISHLLAKQLQRNGKRTKEPTYDMDHNYPFVIRKFAKLICLVRYMFLNHHNHVVLKKFLIKKGYRGLALLSQMANITPKLQEYDSAKEDFVLFDEGLVQSAISISNGKVDLKNIENFLFGLCRRRKRIKILIDVSCKVAYLRMKRRKKHDSRIERIKSKKEKKHALKRLKNIFVSDENMEILINGEKESPDELAERILAILL